MSQQYRIDYDDLKEFQQKYIIGQKLGSGSFGEVFILDYKNGNKNQEEKEELAVKQLNCSYGKKMMQENEVESLQKIKLLPEKYKKRFLQVKNVYFDNINEFIYMVMPMAQQSLYDDIKIRIQNQEFYSQEDLYFKLSCALEGLFTLETLGMAHRDIKAGNLLVMKDGSLVIADLGTAKKLDYQIQQMTIKKGTYQYQYWPPEQIDNHIKIYEIGYIEYLKSPEANKNFKTNDLYGIGLCFIIAASLSLLPYLQNEEFDSLNKYKNEREIWIDNQLNKMRNKYDIEFIDLLQGMVTQDQSKRFSLLQCAENLSQIWEKNQKNK